MSDKDFFERLAKIESGGNAAARAKTSSATGLYQMTRGTFDDLKRTMPSLRNVSWEDHAKNPELQKKFANALTARNDQELTQKGHDANDLNRYLAHFAGVSGADKLLRADPTAAVGDILGKNAAKANKSLAGMSVSQLKDYFGKKLGVQSYDQARKTQIAPQDLPDYSKLSASLGARPQAGASTPYASSLLAVPTAVAINRTGRLGLPLSSGDEQTAAPQMQTAASGGLLHYKRGKKVKKHHRDDDDGASQSAPEANEPLDISQFTRQTTPVNLQAPVQALSPMQQQGALAQIAAQKQQAANGMQGMAPPGAPPPAAPPGAPPLGAPPPSPAPGAMPGASPPPQNGLSSQAAPPPPVAGTGSAISQPSLGSNPSLEGGALNPIDARLRKSADLKVLEDERADDAGGKPSAFASGGVIRFNEGGSAPWEDYGNASKNSGEAGPWQDYTSPTQGSPKEAAKKTEQPKTFGQKARDFLSQVLDQTASSLNTRPEQLTGQKDANGLPTFREKTAQEQEQGPTNAARRARRTAGFIQGAAVDLPAAIAQMVPGKGGEDVANAQLSGYENFRNQLGGKDEIDLARIGGNFAGPGGVKLASGIDSLLARTGAGLFKRGAVQGAAAGAAQPVNPDESGKTDSLLSDKLSQVGSGALLGGSLNKLLGKTAPNSIAANKQSNIDKYREMFPEADLTWGQHLGGRFNQFEQMMSSYPFVGNIIRDARNKAFESQNVGMMSHALKDAGITLDKGSQAGRGLFDQAYNKLTGKYSSLLEDAKLADPKTLRGKIYGMMDTGSGKSLATADQLSDSYKPGVISNDYNRLSEEGQGKFDRVMDSFFKKFGKDPQGNHSLSMDGRQFKNHEEDFKDIIGDYMSGGGEDRTIGRMLKKSLGEIYNSLGSDKPDVASSLKKLNKSYAQYKVLENASTAAGASEGRFTPAQTIRAATKGSRSQVARGKGLLQDEADLSQEVLGQHYPDSGTAGRLQSGNLARDLIGGALSLPLELAYSPKVASTVLQGGTKAKRAFQGTGLGSKIANNAPTGVPGAVRALLGPSDSGPQGEEEPGAWLAAQARGGLTPRAHELTAHYARGGTAMGGALGNFVNPPKFDEGGQVDPASLVGQDSPDGPRIPALFDQYTSYLDKNISQGRRDMENGFNYSKERGLHVKDPEALRRTVDNMNLAGTFIGPSSKLWNKAAESEFVKREALEPAKALWKELGVGRDPAGFLKQEISDLGATMKGKLGAMPITAQQGFEHPSLFEAYPHLKDAFMTRMGGHARGQYTQSINSKTGLPEWERISLNPDHLPLDSQKTSTALHEFQHAIQNHEKWLPGGSAAREGAEMAKKLGIKSPRETEAHRTFLKDRLEEAKKDPTIDDTGVAYIEKLLKRANGKVVTDADKFKAYKRLLGEAEARLTQKRMTMNDAQRREYYPFSNGTGGYDVPMEELITGGYRGFPLKK